MEPRTFQAALQAAQRGDRAGAFQLMRQALLENPNYAPAWFWLSRLVDDSARQRECLERALAIDPNYAPARGDLENLRLRELLATARSIVVAEHTQEPRKIAIRLQQRRTAPAQDARPHFTCEAGEQRRKQQHQQHLRALHGEIEDHGHSASTVSSETSAQKTRLRYWRMVRNWR